MNWDFTDKVLIVTGAGIGIGFEIARQFVLAGGAVVLNDIDGEVAITAKAKLIELGGKCEVVSGDSSNLDIIEEMIRGAVDNFGQVDYALANAGITTFGGFLSYKAEDFDQLTAINLKGSFFLAQASAKQIIKQRTKGKIVFMSSVTGHQAHPNLAAYGMTKSALEMLAKSLGVELAANGITVNAVAPGATLTERTCTDPGYENTWNKLTPTGRAATTRDIANTILFLLSEAADQITSQTIIVDGGWTSVSPPPE